MQSGWHLNREFTPHCRQEGDRERERGFLHAPSASLIPFADSLDGELSICVSSQSAPHHSGGISFLPPFDSTNNFYEVSKL